MNVAFSGTLDERMFRRAIAGPLRGTRLLGILFVSVAIIGALSSFGASALREARAQLPPILFLGLFGVVLLLTPWLAARKQIKTSKLLRSPTSGSATDTGLHLESAYGTSDIPWSAFHRVKVYPHTVLLYQSAAVFHTIPREFFENQAAWEGFVGLVRAGVPRPPSHFIRNVLIWLALVGLILIVFRVTGAA